MWPGPLDHHVKAELHRVHAVGDLPLLAPAHMVAMTNVGRTGTNHAPGPPRRAARMALVMMLLTQHFSIFHAQSTFDLQSMINYSCLQRLSLQTLGTAPCVAESSLVTINTDINSSSKRSIARRVSSDA